MTPMYDPQAQIDRNQDTAHSWPGLAGYLKGLGPALLLTLAFGTLSIDRVLPTLCIVGLLQG